MAAKVAYLYGHNIMSRLLIAREKELENEELSDIGDYEEYAEAVGSSLMYLSLQCGNIHENEDTVSVTQGGISSGKKNGKKAYATLVTT